jgi:hypothetical protein
MTEVSRERQLECAGRALAGALAHKDRKTVAALLRLAARYIEGDESAGEVGPLIRSLA